MECTTPLKRKLDTSVRERRSGRSMDAWTSSPSLSAKKSYSV
ncbi:unnamed protein product [Nippostrongylus brasiliensis]|uniref:Uncharacterized protein n=1 Tax=Nippostrongylus brasiliensis TaxID=27835 RepID=A0A0N4XPT5_NIPBR|nr:unnamed protein product [Nippostrongylus brasiliensis]